MRERDPWIQKRQVGWRLRTLREQAGRKQQEVAAEKEWSVSKVIRIENATVHVSISDLRSLLADYRLDEGETAALLDVARASRREPWLDDYGDLATPRLRRAVAYESAAVRIRQFQLQVVPGVLQTESYSRAVLSMFFPEDRLDGAVAVRMERRRRLLDQDPPRMDVVVDESVLLRAVGGADTMRGQLDHLLTMAGHEWLSLSVVPLAAGAHLGLVGSFALLDLEPDVGIGTILDIEPGLGEEYLSDRDHELVETYRRHYDDLAKVAVGGEDALAILRRCRSQLAAG